VDNLGLRKLSWKAVEAKIKKVLRWETVEIKVKKLLSWKAGKLAIKKLDGKRLMWERRNL
jgi:hypothetical protein